MSPRATLNALTAAFAVALALTGCGGAGSSGPGAAPNTAGETSELAVTDAWVKSASGGMTAAFATLTNTTDHQVTVTGVTTQASGMVQLHEVVMVGGVSQMQPKTGGFVVPPHGTHTLAPGGDHIMLMDLAKPIQPGDSLPFVLSLRDGTTVRFTAVAKDYSGADESYNPSGSPTAGMGGTPGTPSSTP